MHTVYYIIGTFIVVLGLLVGVVGFMEINEIALGVGLGTAISGLLFFAIGRVLFALGEIRNAVVAGFKLQEARDENVRDAPNRLPQDSAVADYVKSLNPEPTKSKSWWVPLLVFIVISVAVYWVIF